MGRCQALTKREEAMQEDLHDECVDQDTAPVEHGPTFDHRWLARSGYCMVPSLIIEIKSCC
jgi:hypothetical protein